MSSGQKVYTNTQDLLHDYFNYQYYNKSLSDIAKENGCTEDSIKKAFSKLEKNEPDVLKYGVKKIEDLLCDQGERFKDSNSFFIILNDKTIDYFIRSAFRYFTYNTGFSYEDEDSVNILIRKIFPNDKEQEMLSISIIEDSVTFRALQINKHYTGFNFYRLLKPENSDEIQIVKRVKKRSEKIVAFTTEDTKKYIKKKLKKHNFIFVPNILHLACFEESKLCLNNIYL